MNNRNQHVEVAAVQKQISERLGMKPDNLVFEFYDKSGRTNLDLITINPRHNQSFLFHSTTGVDKEDAVRKMLDYVENYRDNESSFTIQWMAKGDKELHTSYFRARNVYEALDKLNYGRDMATITVYSVVLNPSS